MTWVVGASSIFGYGVAISDVRISFSDGSEYDMLRKVYPIGPYLLGGFAGSVAIGMRMLAELQLWLDSQTKDQFDVFLPQLVIDDWQPIAKRIFASFDPIEQSGGCQLLIVGVSPTEDMGVPEFRRVYLAKMTGPNFSPEYAEKGFSVLHIGSGSDIEDFVGAVQDHFSISSDSLKAEMGGPAGWSQMLAYHVGRLVRENPVDGIGHHVNVATCHLGKFLSGNNDERIFHPDGTITEIKMPRIANNYQEFCEMCKEAGKGAVGAVG